MRGEQWLLSTLTSARLLILSYNILLHKVRKYGLDEWTVRCIKKWLKGRAQRVMISGVESSWRPLVSGFP